MRRVKPAVVLCLLLLPSLYLAIRFARLDHLGALGDDGIYLITAKSLAEGHGYRISSLPGQPWQTKYPVLYPLALAAVWKLAPPFPAGLTRVMAFSWLLLPVFAILSLRLAADLGLIGWQRYFLAAMVTLHPMVLYVTLTPMSELLFACFLIGSLVLLRIAGGLQTGWIWALAAGLAGAAAYLTRTAGLPLLLVGPAFLLRRHFYRKTAAFLGGLLPAVAGWNWWVRAHASATGDLSRAFYLDYFRTYRLDMTWHDFPDMVLANLAHLFQSLGGSILLMPDESRLLRAVGLVVVIASLPLLQRCGVTPYHLFAGLYCLLLLVLPYTPNERFVVPVMPVFLAGVVAALNRRALVLAAVGLAVLCAVGVAGPRYLTGQLRQFTEIGLEIQEAYRWIRTSVPQQAQFISAYDTDIYLLTGRRGIAFTFPTALTYKGDEIRSRAALENLPRYARSHGFDYVLTTPFAVVSFMRESENAIAGQVLREHFDPVFCAGSVSIYRLRAQP